MQSGTARRAIPVNGGVAAPTPEAAPNPTDRGSATLARPRPAALEGQVFRLQVVGDEDDSSGRRGCGGDEAALPE